jgi:hypothetical protein
MRTRRRSDGKPPAGALPGPENNPKPAELLLDEVHLRLRFGDALLSSRNVVDPVGSGSGNWLSCHGRASLGTARRPAVLRWLRDG